MDHFLMRVDHPDGPNVRSKEFLAVVDLTAPTGRKVCWRRQFVGVAV